MGTISVTNKAVPNLVEYSDSECDEQEFFDAHDFDNPIEAKPALLPSVELKTESPKAISKEEGHFNAKSTYDFERSTASESELSSQGNNNSSVGVAGWGSGARMISLEESLEGNGVETSKHGKGKGEDEDVEMGGVGELEVERGAPSLGLVNVTLSNDQLMKESVDGDEEYEPTGAEAGSKGEWTRANKSSGELLDHYSYFYGI